MFTVLVCDDDKAILDSIEIYLRQDGYNVLKAENGIEAIEIIKNNSVHCCIMDIMMPGLDGLSATVKLREKNNIPIILLSAKSEDTDKIAGLSFGADDYVTKPFNPLELLARVKSQIRRYTMLGSLEAKEGEITTGGLTVNTVTKEVTVDGEQVKLTATEYGILEFLIKNLGRVFTTRQIYEAVWDEECFAADKTVTVHIRRIREKIEINPKDPKYLMVVWGLGYKVEKYQ
ncbi:MAG: response regulator transcription factor [Clostridia bacterium]|nr:response regulator transcription factor [Clostridia bacterium]